MPAPFQLPCFCYECLHQDKEHKKGQNGFKFENADHEEDLSASHLPYFLTAFVCHLGATISSGWLSCIWYFSLIELRCHWNSF